MIKRNIAKLNAGDDARRWRCTPTTPRSPSPATTLGDDVPAARGRRDADPTHRGRDRDRGVPQRYTAHGIQMVVDDILVNGPPWNARAAVRCHDWVPGDAAGPYDNRAVMWVRTRWGRIVEHEDYEDTQRTAAYDADLAAVTSDGLTPASRRSLVRALGLSPC